MKKNIIFCLATLFISVISLPTFSREHGPLKAKKPLVVLSAEIMNIRASPRFPY